MQAEKGSCNDARNGMYEESMGKQCHSMVCGQQPNGNVSIRTLKKVRLISLLRWLLELLITAINWYLETSLESHAMNFLFAMRSPNYQLFKVYCISDDMGHYSIAMILILISSRSRFKHSYMLIRHSLSHQDVCICSLWILDQHGLFDYSGLGDPWHSKFPQKMFQQRKW